MQVTHLEEAKTHVVVGGQDVQAFGMADTREFFNILSNTLYSNKRLAVVREVLCNSWDAHIASNRQHIPVKITLDADKMTFKDSGFGIHHKVIGPIYCVYGNSTKAHNGTENGGFGLGSKAPFAYTDHFTVTSIHEGVKTVYAVSRGSKETDGKPDFRTVIQVPAQPGESGLEVTIPIHNGGDVNVFSKIITQIALFGDMNVELNGKPLARLPFSTARDGAVLISREHPLIDRHNLSFEHVWVRYGTVIYPVPDDEFYSKDYDKLRALTLNNKYMLILQAPPNMISVTPSRESLSMTDRTKETIRGLLEKFLIGYRNEPAGVVFADLADLMARWVNRQSAHPNDWLQFIYNMNFSFSAIFRSTLGNYFDSIYDMKRFLMAGSADFRGATHIDYKLRCEMVLDALSYHMPSRAKELRILRQVIRRSVTHPRFGSYGDLYYKVLNKFYLDTVAATLEPRDRDTFRLVRWSNYGRKHFYSLDEADNHISGILKIDEIVVGMNQDGIIEEATRADISDQMVCVYQPRKKGQKERIMKALEGAGYEVIDATHLVKHKPKPLDAVPKDKGYLRLDQCVGKYPQTHYQPNQLSLPGKKRIEKPQYAFYEISRDRERVLYGWWKRDLGPIIALCPDAVVVSSERTLTSLEKKYGTKNAYDHICTLVSSMLEEKDSMLVKYLAQQDEKFGGDYSILTKIAKISPDVQKALDLKQITDHRYEAAAAVIKAGEYYTADYKLRNLNIRARNLVLEYNKRSDFARTVNENPLLGFLDLEGIYQSLVAKYRTKEAEALLTFALKG